jgi:malate dehydrogenase (oxaloacetate-decarboxylating)
MMQIEKGVDKIVKTIRLLILDQPGYLGRVATAVGNAGGNITDLHLVSYGVEYNTRDLTLFIDDEAQLQEVLAEIGKVEGVIISEIIDPVLEMHRGGKIPGEKPGSASTAWPPCARSTRPGVAKVCKLIEADARAEVRVHLDRQHGGHRHQRHGHPGPGRHRCRWPACR